MPLCPSSQFLLPDRYYTVVANAAARPTGGALFTGMMIYQADIASQLMWDGTGWIMMAEPRQTWTPAFATGVTVGNGVFVAGFHRHDGWVDFDFQFTLGTTSAITGDVSLPPPIAIASTDQLTNSVNVGLNVPGTEQAGMSVWSSGNLYLRAQSTAGAYSTQATLSSTVPATWATGNVLRAHGRYKMSTRYL